MSSVVLRYILPADGGLVDTICTTDVGRCLSEIRLVGVDTILGIWDGPKYRWIPTGGDDERSVLLKGVVAAENDADYGADYILLSSDAGRMSIIEFLVAPTPHFESLYQEVYGKSGSRYVV